MNCYGPLGTLFSFIWPTRIESSCLAGLAMGVSPPDVSILLYFYFFLLTCALEAPVYLAVSRTKKIALRQSLFQGFMLNLSTHPFVFFLLPHGVIYWNGLAERFELSSRGFLLSAEIFAILCEAMLLGTLWRYSPVQAVGSSLTANLTSWGLGSILVEYFFKVLRT